MSTMSSFICGNSAVIIFSCVSLCLFDVFVSRFVLFFSYLIHWCSSCLFIFVCCHLHGIILHYVWFYLFHPGFVFAFRPCLLLWNLFIHISCSCIDLLSCARMWFLHGRLVKAWNKYLQWNKKAGRETLYVLICDSHGSCKSPLGNGEFLYVFFYISHYVCVPCLFQCYALTSEVNFTLCLIFYLSNLFYIPPSTHFTPLMCFFLPFLCTFQVSQMCPYCAL